REAHRRRRRRRDRRAGVGSGAGGGGARRDRRRRAPGGARRWSGGGCVNENATAVTTSWTSGGRLDAVIDRAIAAPVRLPHAGGLWDAPVHVGPALATRLAAEHVLLHHLLRRPLSEAAAELPAVLVARQGSDGTWGTLGTTILVYLVAKLAGH